MGKRSILPRNAMVTMQLDIKLSRIPVPLRRIATVLRRHGFDAVVVGGAVRELLLGQTPQDWDLATSADAGQVRRCFQRVVPVGIKHGTVLVIEDGFSCEVTTFRRPGVSKTNRRRPSSPAANLSTDLACRDFTVNAIALYPATGALIDEHGGIDDLRRGRLRAVGNPAHRFNEDPLRVLRAARLAATCGWLLKASTRRAMPAYAKRLRRVAAERLRRELERLLLAAQPSIGLDIMRRSGQLAVVLPELAACVGVRQNHYHRYDVYRHTLRCIDAAPRDPALRWAALLHDIGKPAAKVYVRRRVHFYGHEQVSLRLAEQVLRRLRSSTELQRRVLHLIAHHLLGYSSEWSNAAVRRFIRRIGEARVEALLAFARADALARGMGAEPAALVDELARRVAEQRRPPAARRWTVLAVNGNDVQRVLGLRSGPMIGRILAELRDYVTEDPNRNTRRQLLSYLRRRTTPHSAAPAKS